MWWAFLLLYCSYLILGPHWESKLLKGEKLAIVDSKEELGRRSIFISYVALLFIFVVFTPTFSIFFHECSHSNHRCDYWVSHEVWN
jgi:hypothetical protein